MVDDLTSREMKTRNFQYLEYRIQPGIKIKTGIYVKPFKIIIGIGWLRALADSNPSRPNIPWLIPGGRPLPFCPTTPRTTRSSEYTARPPRGPCTRWAGILQRRQRLREPAAHTNSSAAATTFGISDGDPVVTHDRSDGVRAPVGRLDNAAERQRAGHGGIRFGDSGDRTPYRGRNKRPGEISVANEEAYR